MALGHLLSLSLIFTASNAASVAVGVKTAVGAAGSVISPISKLIHWDGVPWPTCHWETALKNTTCNGTALMIDPAKYQIFWCITACHVYFKDYRLLAEARAVMKEMGGWHHSWHSRFISHILD